LKAPAKGRPPKTLQEALVRDVVGCLTSAGWTVSRSCDFLQRIMRSCFDLEVDAEALAKQWTRLQGRADTGAPSA
jgi:hypothetical protein